MIKYDRLWATMQSKGISTYWLREKCGIDREQFREQVRLFSYSVSQIPNLPFICVCNIYRTDLEEEVKTCTIYSSCQKTSHLIPILLMALQLLLTEL